MNRKPLIMNCCLTQNYQPIKHHGCENFVATKLDEDWCVLVES